MWSTFFFFTVSRVQLVFQVEVLYRTPPSASFQGVSLFQTAHVHIMPDIPVQPGLPRFQWDVFHSQIPPNFVDRLCVPKRPIFLPSYCSYFCSPFSDRPLLIRVFVLVWLLQLDVSTVHYRYFSTDFAAYRDLRFVRVHIHSLLVKYCHRLVFTAVSIYYHYPYIRPYVRPSWDLAQSDILRHVPSVMRLLTHFRLAGLYNSTHPTSFYRLSLAISQPDATQCGRPMSSPD